MQHSLLAYLLVPRLWTIRLVRAYIHLIGEDSGYTTMQLGDRSELGGLCLHACPVSGEVGPSSDDLLLPHLNLMSTSTFSLPSSTRTARSVLTLIESIEQWSLILNTTFSLCSSRSSIGQVGRGRRQSFTECFGAYPGL